jgi:DNA-binding LacI/PurR family transcriptional regulator
VIGCEAVRCLLSRISGEETGPLCVIMLQPRLIVRDSCRPLA